MRKLAKPTEVDRVDKMVTMISDFMCHEWDMESAHIDNDERTPYAIALEYVDRVSRCACDNEWLYMRRQSNRVH